jgi:hypothetical protein
MVMGISSDEASATVNWENFVFYQGDVAPARITFISNFSQPLEIYYVGINFDWMAEDNFQGRDFSANPITVPSYGSHTFDLMVFQIPFDVSAGVHEYFVGIDGSYGGSEGSLPIGFSWDSDIFTLQVLNTAQRSYLEKDAEVSSKINNASELTYDSPEARNLISQAQAAYSSANDYATNGQFQEAIASLEIASNYVDLANQEEQTFDLQQQDQNQTLMMILIIGVIVVLVVIIIFMLIPKMKKTAEKSVQTTLETES